MVDFRKTGKLYWERRIPGAAKSSCMWLVPKDVKKPAGGRIKRRKESDSK